MKLFSLDIETTGLNRFKDEILCIGVWSPNESHCFKTVSEFVRWHQSGHSYVCHSGAFDVNFLRTHGIDIRANWTFDTKSLASIVCPSPRLGQGQRSVLSLENLALVLLNHVPYKLDRHNMSNYAWSVLSEYNLKDCQYTFELFDWLLNNLSEKDWKFVENWLMPATKICADLNYDGVHIDDLGLMAYRGKVEEQFKKVKQELNEISSFAQSHYRELRIKELKDTYAEMATKAIEKAKDKEKAKRRYDNLFSSAAKKIEPFNFSSPKQLAWLLRDYYHLDIRNEREDKETTNEAKLKELDHPIAKKLVQYRELDKMLSTCIPALLGNLSKDKTLHANYHIGGTRTGRLSSSGPNLQQIPRGPIRSYVQASNGNRLVTIDFAQIEVRLIAEASQERELLSAFDRGVDPYSVIAKKLLKIETPVEEIKEKHKKERDVSKTAGLSILYGTGAKKLKEVLAKELNRSYTIQECQSFIEDYRDSLPAVKEFKWKLERALANQRVYYNLLGRPFYIEFNEDIYMKGLNTLVQGSASDLVIDSQIEVNKALSKLKVPNVLRMLIHDEAVRELPESEAESLTQEVIIPIMTTRMQEKHNLTVPLKVEYSINKVWEKP